MADSTTTEHPDLEQLRAFHRGTIDDVSAQQIERHLVSCDACTDYLTNLPVGPLLSDLVRTPATDRNDVREGGRPTNSASTPHSLQADTRTAESEATPDDDGTDTHATFSVGNGGFPDIPDHEILSELGRGGMGIVYKARHRPLGRLVAVKLLLHHDRRDRSTIRRFQKEAELLALLKHPNIVQIHEVRIDDEPPYLSIEYVPGEDLSHRLLSETMSPREAAQLVGQLARAVHAAHEAGVIHRDLKPGNVLLDRESGLPKITDFGLARRLEATAQLTRTGSVLGTPSYMAPEQAETGGETVGTSADVYSLGAVLYECLTGRPPFKAPDAVQTLFQVIHEPPVAPGRLHATLPRDLETICLKCLEKSPRRRYGTADELADDLQRFVAGEPVSARPLGIVHRSWRWVRRHPAQTGLLTAVIVAMFAVVGMTVGWIYQEQLQSTNTRLEASNDQLATVNRRLDVALQDANAAKKRVQRALDSESRAKSALDRLLCFRRVSTALTEWREREVVRARRILEECPRELRGWEWHYVYNVCHPARQTLRDGDENRFNAVAYSPNGEFLAGGGSRGRVSIWIASSGRKTHSFNLPNCTIHGLTFSPDGRFLAGCGSDKRVRIWDFNEKRLLHKLTGHTLPVLDVKFSPDGKRLASCGGDKTARVWNAETGRLLQTLSGHRETVYGVAFSPDGRRLASSSYDGTIRIWNARTGGEISTLKGHKGRVAGIAFSPRGQQVASGSTDRTVRLWNVKTGQTIRVLEGHRASLTRMCFRSDGKQLVTASGDKTVKVWDVKTGETLRTLAGHVQNIVDVALSPEGGQIASCSYDGTIKVWDANAGLEWRRFEGHRGPVFGAALSGDGQRLATAGNDRTVKLWDATSGVFLTTFKGHSRPVNRIAFDPAGKFVASGGMSGAVKIWILEDGTEWKTLNGHTEHVSGLDWSPDGCQIASSSGDGSIRLWDQATGETRKILRSGDGWFQGVKFNWDGTYLAAASTNKSVVVWETATGNEVRILIGHESVPKHVVFNRAGDRIATTDGRSLIIWEFPSGQRILTITPGALERFGPISFSPDGDRLAVAAGKTVRLWDVVTGREAFSLKAHTNSISSLAFSLDGRRLVSSSLDQSAIIWDAPTFKPGVATPPQVREAPDR